MKKEIKIFLIVLVVLVAIIALDTLQAKVFNNSPLLKIRDNLDGGALDYIDKGIFVNHYCCIIRKKLLLGKEQKKINADGTKRWTTAKEYLEIFIEEVK